MISGYVARLESKGIFWVLFFATLFLFLVRFTSWGFINDDFGILTVGRVETWWDLLNPFYNAVGHDCVAQSNTTITHSFFEVYWRPLAFLSYAPQYWLFGLNAYGYFAVCMAVHAVFVGLLGFVFSSFLSPIDAMLAALLAGTHTTLGGWLGWITALQSQQSAILITLSAYYFYRSLSSNARKDKAIALAAFIATCFIRETGVVLPACYASTVFLIRFFKEAQPFFRSVASSLLATSAYWTFFILYMVTRYFLFAREVTTVNYFSLRTFLERFAIRAYNLLTYVMELFDLYWLQSGQGKVKALLLFGMVATLGYCFIKSRYKVELTALALTLLALSWPSLLVNHITRYVIELIPFLAVFVMVAFKSISSLFSSPKAVLFYRTTLGLLILFHVHFVFGKMEQRQSASIIETAALQELTTQEEVKNAPALMFVGLPHYLHKEWSNFSSIRHGINLFLGQKDKIVYLDTGMSVLTDKDVISSPLEILAKHNRLTLTTHSKECWFEKDSPYGEIPFSMGVRTLISTEGPKVYAAEFEIDEKWFKPTILLIGWDYGKDRFNILGVLSPKSGEIHVS